MPFEHVLLYPFFTIGVFYASTLLYEKTGRIAILQPVLVAILALSTMLIIFGIPYVEYAQDMRFFAILLTPAIVALAVPLYQNMKKAQEYLPIILATILIGGSLIVLGGLTLATVAGLEAPYVLPMLTKSVSAPIAISIAEETGAIVALTILGVFTTGLPGAAFIPGLLKLLKVEEDEMKGLVLGMTAHAFGIARSVEISSRATAFATLGMGLMGCFVALIVPTVVKLMGL
jgi:putative effector of murein hydrolase